MSIKYKKYLTLVLLVGLFFPQLSQAALPAISAVIGAIGAIGSTLETIFEPILAQLLVLTVILALSVFILWTTMSFLTMFIDNQSAWIEQLLPVTEAAFDFVVGIANMFLILVFVVIAFAFILKIETFQAKKTLPRLIIVALLMNFSLLFVNMLIDLSQVIYNTILATGGIELFMDAFRLILTKGMGFLLGMYMTMTLLMGLMGAPVIGKIVTAIVGLLAPPILVPLMTFTLFLALFLVFLATPLATLAFLFAARIFVLQILGIVAPLAFLCLVLPQTKKHFDEWLSHLVEWLMLGIVGLFFLSIGFGVIGLLQTDVNLGFKTILGIMVVPIVSLFTWTNPIEVLYKMHSEMFLYFFALFVYMCIVIYILGKNMPALGKVLIEQGKGLMGNLWSMGVKPFTAAGWRQAKAAAAEIPEIKERAEKMETWTGPKNRFGRAVANLLLFPHAVRGLGRAFGSGAAEDERKEFDEAEKKYTGSLYDSKVSALIGEKRGAWRAGIISAFAENNEIDKLLKDSRVQKVLTEQERKEIVKKANQANKGNKITLSLLPAGTKEKQEAWLEEVGVTLDQWEKDKLTVETRLEKIVGRIKPSNVKYLNSEAIESDGAKEAIHKFWGGAHIAQAGTEIGNTFLDTLRKEIESKPVNWYKDNNPLMDKYLRTTSARALGLPSPPRSTP